MGIVPPVGIGEERRLSIFVFNAPLISPPCFPGEEKGAFGRIIPVHTLILTSLRRLCGPSRCLSCFSAKALLRTALPLAVALAMATAVSSCGGGNRRMGEREALDFRRNLVRKNYNGLSPAQRAKIMYHPARTRGAVRLTLDKYIRETADRRTREKAEGASAIRAAGQRGSSEVKSEPVIDEPVPADSPAGEPEKSPPAEEAPED